MEVVVGGLNVWINGRQILYNVELRTAPGRITAVMGPSGSGKSTLLRTLNRLLDLIPGARAEGVVRIGPLNVLEADPYHVRRLTGMVFQEPNPFPHMTIYDNVAIGPRLHRLARSREELDAIVEWALRAAHLWDEVKDRLHDYPHQLSGGQRQRLSLARALALRPRVLLLDEPTANIDPASTEKIEQTIAQYARENKATIILVTHSPTQARRLSHQLVLIQDGRIKRSGSTAELIPNGETKPTLALETI